MKLLTITLFLLLNFTFLFAQTKDTIKTIKDTNTTILKNVIDSSKTKQTKEKPKKEVKVEYYEGRCQATTKKGTQCSRSADGGNKFCWQHD